MIRRALYFVKSILLMSESRTVESIRLAYAFDLRVRGDRMSEMVVWFGWCVGLADAAKSEARDSPMGRLSQSRVSRDIFLGFAGLGSGAGARRRVLLYPYGPELRRLPSFSTIGLFTRSIVRGIGPSSPSWSSALSPRSPPPPLATFRVLPHRSDERHFRSILRGIETGIEERRVDGVEGSDGLDRRRVARSPRERRRDDEVQRWISLISSPGFMSCGHNRAVSVL